MYSGAPIAPFDRNICVRTPQSTKGKGD